MKQFLTSLSDTVKGSLLIIGGGILLLNTMGILEKSLDMIIIGGAIAMIVGGVFLADLPAKINKLMNKKSNDS